MPFVWVHDDFHERAVEAARAAAAGIAELGIPVFLYGELASDEERCERAFFRRGGPAELARRMGSSGCSRTWARARPIPAPERRW